MDDCRYTNRELDSHFTEIKETLKRIEAQTMKTNGRVTALENWKYFITGLVTLLILLKLPDIVAVILQ
jgi:hypothetical protein